MWCFKPPLAVGWGWGSGPSVRTLPLLFQPGSCGGAAAVPSLVLLLSSVLCTLTRPTSIICSRLPPFLRSSSTYLILTVCLFLFCGPLRFGVMSYPPGLLTPNSWLHASNSIDYPSTIHRRTQQPQRWCCSVFSTRNVENPPDPQVCPETPKTVFQGRNP